MKSDVFAPQPFFCFWRHEGAVIEAMIIISASKQEKSSPHSGQQKTPSFDRILETLSAFVINTEFGEDTLVF